MNNYEWIATLTPYELAKFLDSLGCNLRGCDYIGEDCTECWINFLMEEHRDAQ